MKKRRRLLIANNQSGGGDVRHELECFEAGTLIMYNVANDRTFQKKNEGFAIACIHTFYENRTYLNWTNVLILSPYEEQVIFIAGEYGEVQGTLSFEYYGQTWYLSHDGYAVQKSLADTYYYPYLNDICNNGQPYNSGIDFNTTRIQAATDLLDYYFKVI